MNFIIKPHMLIVVLTPLIVSACASSTTTTIQPPTAAVTPSTAEADLDCRQITGRMQVRLLEYRDYTNQSKTTSLSRGLQSAVTSIFGGSKSETDPDAQYRAVRERLERYNALLATKGCKTFDIDRELQGSTTGDTPTPKNPPAQ